MILRKNRPSVMLGLFLNAAVVGSGSPAFAAGPTASSTAESKPPPASSGEARGAGGDKSTSSEAPKAKPEAAKSAKAPAAPPSETHGAAAEKASPTDAPKVKAEPAKSSPSPQNSPGLQGPGPQSSGHGENKAASEKARKLFLDAQAAFAAGEYQKAIDLFRRADAVNPRPELEYNIGLAYDQMGDSASALAAYRSYLRRSPDTADKPEVERQIARLQRELGRGARQQVTIFTDPQGATLLVDGQPVGISPWTGELGTGRHQLVARRQGNIETLREFSLAGDQATELTVSLAVDQKAQAAAQAQLQRERSEKERASQPSAFESIRPLTWGILGAGVAGLAGAAVFEQSRANDEQDARLSTTQVAAQRNLDDAQSQQTAARILLGVGAGAAILGGVFLYVDLKHHSQSSTQLAAGCGTGKCGLFARGKF